MMGFEHLIKGQVEIESLNAEILALTPPAMRDEVMAEVRRLEAEGEVPGLGYTRNMSHIEALRAVSERMKRTGNPNAESTTPHHSKS